MYMVYARVGKDIKTHGDIKFFALPSLCAYPTPHMLLHPSPHLLSLTVGRVTSPHSGHGAKATDIIQRGALHAHDVGPDREVVAW